MRKTDFVVAACFLALGTYLVASSLRLPPGVGTLPGPGFFPGAVGFLMILLSAALLRSSVRRSATAALGIENKRAVAGTLGLTLAYLLLWGTGGFLVRTAVFTVLLLRFFGEGWKTSLIAGALLATAVTLAFQLGLRLTLE